MPSVSAGSDPSAAAEQARARLHEEIERVRAGVEEMLAQEGGGDAQLRSELDQVRADTRRYVKKRVKKTEERLGRRIAVIDERTRELERRLEASEQDRKYGEWRIHTNTEQMLDGLLREIRAIADLLSRAR